MDNIDKLLKDRFGNMRKEPSPEVWERIERDLANDTQMQVTHFKVPVRRKLSPIIVLRYSIAASVLVAIMILGGIYFPRINNADLITNSIIESDVPKVESQPSVIENIVKNVVNPFDVNKEHLFAIDNDQHSENAIIAAKIEPNIIDKGTNYESKIFTYDSVETVVLEYDKSAEQIGKYHAEHTRINDSITSSRSHYNGRIVPMSEQHMYKLPVRRKIANASLYASNMVGSSDADGLNNGPVKSGGPDFKEVAINHSHSNSPTLLNAQHKMPLSFGLGFGYHLSDKVVLESGLTYSYLESEWNIESSTGVFNYNLTQRLHYIGVPLSAIYRFSDGRTVGFYCRAGAMLEIGVAGRKIQQVASSQKTTTSIDMNKLQPSLFTNLGCDIGLTNRMKLYLEPGLSYYPIQDNQPESYRTENPLNFSIKLGVRFSIGRR